MSKAKVKALLFWCRDVSFMGRSGQIKHILLGFVGEVHLCLHSYRSTGKKGLVFPCVWVRYCVSCWFPLFNAQFKLCKGQSVLYGQKGIPYLNSYDIQARIIKAKDTIKLDLENNNIIDSIKCDAGNVVKEAG